MEPGRQFDSHREHNAYNNAQNALSDSFTTKTNYATATTAKRYGALTNSINSKGRENSREASTRVLASQNKSVQELDRAYKSDPKHPGFEVSGDALARAKAGQPPKYHREV